jgi:hypothetical protein
MNLFRSEKQNEIEYWINLVTSDDLNDVNPVRVISVVICYRNSPALNHRDQVEYDYNNRFVIEVFDEKYVDLFENNL